MIFDKTCSSIYDILDITTTCINHGYKPEVLLHALEEKECYVSTKSTCSSHKDDISHTLASMHLKDEVASSAIRISFSHLTTKKEIDEFLYHLHHILKTIKKQR